MGDAFLKAPDAGRLEPVSALLLAFVWIVELAIIVRPNAALALAASVALAGFLVMALGHGSRHIRMLFVVVVALAAALAWLGGVPEALARGYARSLIFGAFLPSVLLLRATVEASPLLERLGGDLGRLDDASSQNWTLYGSHSLGAVLNVGAMSILAPLVARRAQAPRRRLLAAASARGVATAIMWSPFFVSIAFTSQLVPQAAVWQVMPIGAGLAAIGLAISHALYTPSLGAAAFRESIARLRPLALPGVVLVGAVVAANAGLGFSGLQAVALVVPLLCAAYLLSLGPRAASATARRTLHSFARLSDELLIVVGATVIAAVVSGLPAVQALGGSVSPGWIPGPVMMGLLVFALVGLGMTGLHPMIGVGILVPVLASGPFGICPPVLVLTAVFAWGLNASISPWTLPLVAASTHFGVPMRELVTRRSLLFGLLYGVAGIVYLGGVNALCQPG